MRPCKNLLNQAFAGHVDSFGEYRSKPSFPVLECVPVLCTNFATASTLTCSKVDLGTVKMKWKGGIFLTFREKTR
jgi:hypothetical protein